MATQKHGVSTVLVSALVGVLIVAVCALGLFALNGGLSSAVFGGASAGHDKATVETRQIVDSLGRTVQVPSDPQHIAALDSFSGNVCVLVGAGEKLMGAPGGVIRNVMLQRICPSLASVDQLSGNSVNVETLLAANVDVALIKRDMYDGGQETAKLDKMGIPYVVVDYSSVDEQIDAIDLVGQVCGPVASEKGAAITQYYRDTVSLVKDRAADIPQEQRARVYHSINDPLLTDGSDSLGADWITAIGAIDVSAQEKGVGGSGDYTATLEQVYAWNPTNIVCSTAAAKDTIVSSAQWQGMQAVSNGAVSNLPVSTSRWGQRGDPETFLGMLWLAKTLYPDRYTDIDLKQSVTSYYRDIIGLEVDDATWDAIVSGEGLRLQGTGNNGGSGSGGGK